LIFLRDALRKTTIFAKNPKNAKGIVTFYKKTLPNAHTHDFDLSKRSTELMFFFLNVERITVLNGFFEVLKPNGPRANEVPNWISEGEELDF